MEDTVDTNHSRQTESVFRVDELSKWLTVEYYRSLSNHVSDAQRYFNQLISWGNSLVLANVLAVAVSVVVGKNGIPYEALGILGLFMLTLLHYLVLRSARGYANLIRFTSIQKEITEWMIGGSPSSKLQSIYDHIQTFHINWESPLLRGPILSKVWLNSGYFFHAIVVLSMLLYCLNKIVLDRFWLFLFALTFSVNLILFYCYFVKSRYFEKCRNFPLTNKSGQP